MNTNTSTNTTMSSSHSHSTPITTCVSSTSNTGTTSAPFPQLFRCLHDHDWSQALDIAHAYPYEAGYVDEHGMTALHYAAGSANIPVALISALLHAYPPSGLMRDYQGFTPLHYACSYYNSSPELILCLLEHAPSIAAVSKRDKFDKTPLHHLIQGNEFLMSKKIQAHHRRRRQETGTMTITTSESQSPGTHQNTHTHTSLLQPLALPGVPLSATPLSTNPKDDLVFSSLWRKAAYLIKAAYHGVVSNPLPHYKSFKMLHACVATPDCPLRLVELVLLVHPEQATQMDEDGHIPIQIVAKRHLVSAIQSVRYTTTKEDPHLYHTHPHHQQQAMTTTSLDQDYHTNIGYSNYNVQSNSYISSSSSSPNTSLNMHMHTNENASGSASSRSATPTTCSAPTAGSNSRFSFQPLPQTTTSQASAASTSHSSRRDSLSSPSKHSSYQVTKKAFNSLVSRPKSVPQRSKTTGTSTGMSTSSNPHPHSNNTQIVPQQQQQTQMQLQQQKRNSYKLQSEQSMAILWILLSLASAPEQLEHTRTKKLLRKVCESSRSIHSHNQHHHMIGALDSQHVRGMIQQLMMEGSSGTSSSSHPSSSQPQESHSLQGELSMFPWRIVPMNAVPKPPAPASKNTGTAVVVDKELQDIHNHLLMLQKSRSNDTESPPHSKSRSTQQPQTHSPRGVQDAHHEQYHQNKMTSRNAVGAPPQAQALAIPLMDPQTHHQQQQLHRQREFQRHPPQQQQQYHKAHVPSPKKTMPPKTNPSTPKRSSNNPTTMSPATSGNKQHRSNKQLTPSRKHHKNKLSVSSGGGSTSSLSPFKTSGAHSNPKNLRKQQSKKAITGGSTGSSHSKNNGSHSKKSSTITKSSPVKTPTKPSSTSMRNMNNSPVMIMEQRQDTDTTANSHRRGGTHSSPKKFNHASASVHSKQSQSRRDQTIKSSSQRRHHHVF
jgi:hypothetical protein